MAIQVIDARVMWTATRMTGTPVKYCRYPTEPLRGEEAGDDADPPRGESVSVLSGSPADEENESQGHDGNETVNTRDIANKEGESLCDLGLVASAVGPGAVTIVPDSNKMPPRTTTAASRR